MVHIEEVEHIQSIPRLYTLTLADDGSPAQDKTVSHHANYYFNSTNNAFLYSISAFLFLKAM